MVDTSGVIRGIDPYIFWILGPGGRYFFLPGRGKQWLPLFIRLSETDSSGKPITARSFAEGEHLDDRRREAWRDAVQVPTLFTESEIGANEGPYITALMSADYTKEFIDDVDLRAEMRAAVESVSPSRPLDAASLTASSGTPPSATEALEKEPYEPTADAALPEGTVIMGIIDDGIAFAHNRFRKIVGGNIETRVEHWWLQDGPYKPNYFPFLPAGSQDVPSGCELNKRQINDLLADCTQGGVVDEHLVYRKAKLIDFQQAGHKSADWRIAHGTHVMDLACGAKPDPPCNDRPIICVQLPIRVTADTSGGHLYKYVVEAIWYILDRASKIPGAAHTPVVINLSYGRFEGPHDGRADIERAIEAIILLVWRFRRVRLRVCLPAGNNYLSRTHAKIRFEALDETVTLPWRVLPDDRTPSFAEIWLPKRHHGGANRLNVTITAPTGEAHTVGEGGFAQWPGGGGPVYAEVRYYIPPATKRRMFRISLLATASLDSTAPLAPAGIWKIELQNLKLAGKDAVHAWVQRDDSLYGFPLRGRQSFFDDPKYVRFDHTGREKETDDALSRVKRKSTINAMATGKSPVVAGGYMRKEMAAAKYSTSGARRPPPRRPDAMAPSEDSRVHSGILAAGSHSGSVVAMGGTSVAAPQIARLVADNIAGGGAGNRKAVRLRAALDESGYPLGTPPKPPRWRGGAGRIKIAPLVKLKRYDGP